VSEELLTLERWVPTGALDTDADAVSFAQPATTAVTTMSMSSRSIL
jgi:hypothetical protein